MNALIRLSLKAIRFASRHRDQALDILWRAEFLAQAAVCGGKVVLGRGVRFEHRTRFMGCGTVVLEDGVVLGYGLAGALGDPILLEPREADAVIRVGARTYLVNGTEIIARERVDIGSDCRIGERTTIIDSDFHGIRPDERDKPGKTAPVVIGDNVWLGNEVMVLKGVTIGKSAVIGARTVVTGDVSEGAVVTGAAMRVVGDVERGRP